MEETNKISELIKYKERLEETLSGTNCGTFTHDFSTGFINFDERAQHLLGSKESTVTFDDWVELIHPDDDGIPSKIQKELESQNPHINISYRIITKESIKHIKVDSFVKYLHGKPYVTYGLVQDISDLKEREIELEKLNKELNDTANKLQKALKEIKTLKGIIPICAYCHKIRDDEGAWNQLEAYISKHSEAAFSHGICPSCLESEKKNN